MCAAALSARQHAMTDRIGGRWLANLRGACSPRNRSGFPKSGSIPAVKESIGDARAWRDKRKPSRAVGRACASNREVAGAQQTCRKSMSRWCITKYVVAVRGGVPQSLYAPRLAFGQQVKARPTHVADCPGAQGPSIDLCQRFRAFRAIAIGMSPLRSHSDRAHKSLDTFSTHVFGCSCQRCVVALLGCAVLLLMVAEICSPSRRLQVVVFREDGP